MSDDDVQLLNNYKAEQQKFIASIKKTESLLGVLCQSINAQAGHDKWWLNHAWGHIRDGMLGLSQAVTGTMTDDELLQNLKVRQQQGVNDDEQFSDRDNQASSEDGTGVERSRQNVSEQA